MRSQLSSALAAPSDEDRVLVVRLAGESDWDFILDSWLKSYSFSRFAQVRGSKYYAEEERIARWCIDRGRLLVAAAEDSPDAILGWICGVREPATVDYVYVKSPARRCAVASGLVQSLLGGSDWRAVRPRMTHRPHRKIKELVEKAGWVFAPVTGEEMGG